jgi:hypothetical protein
LVEFIGKSTFDLVDREVAAVNRLDMVDGAADERSAGDRARRYD